MNCICLTNMKFNAILPLKWQNTADIVAILVGLKQETVSLMCRKCAGSVARWLHLSEEEDGRNSVSCITPYGMVHETLFLCPDDTERMWKQRQAEYLFCLQKCTNCSSLRNFYILLFRHLLFVGVLWFPFLKLHFPNYSFWYQLSWFLSKYHYYSFFHWYMKLRIEI